MKIPFNTRILALGLAMALFGALAQAKDCAEDLLLSKNDQRQQQAAALGLNPAQDSDFTIRRFSRRGHFVYLNTSGTMITSDRVLSRIDGLGIRNGLHDARISTDPKSHIQVVGVDDAGRAQYIYHPLWDEVRKRVKFENSMPAFGEILPVLREKVAADLRGSNLSEKRLYAAITRLLDETLIRVGNKEYADQNKTYGLTTLLKSHVKLNGNQITFSFLGKSDVRHNLVYISAPIAKLIRELLEVPGASLFKFIDENGEAHEVPSNSVNDYIKEITQADFSAKDFRTWGGTVAAADYLYSRPYPTTAKALKSLLNEATQATAELLENTPAVSRSSYIHPLIYKVYSEDHDRFTAAFAKARKRLDRGATGRGLAEEAVLILVNDPN